MLSQTWRHITYEHRNCWVWAYLEMIVSFYTPFDLSSYCTCIQVSNNLGGIFETLLAFTSDIWGRAHFRLYSVSKFPGELSHDAGFIVAINYFYQIQICALCANRYETAHDATKTTCTDWEKTIFRSKYIGYLDWNNIFRSGYITSGAYLDRHMIIRHI